MNPIQLLYPHLNDHKNIVVTMHQKPDPDAMGSSLALAIFLQKLGHSVKVISPTNWPDFLNWMPGSDSVLDFESHHDYSIKYIQAADWIFCLDLNALYRTKKMEPELLKASGHRIMIDHHEEPHTESFHYGVSVIPKSSTCEMVYDFIVESGHQALIDSDIAACLYAGVMSDTGSFKFPVTTPSVHAMVSELMKTGINHSQIHQSIYDNFLENRLRFIGHLLSNRLEVIYECNAAVMHVSKSDIQKFQITTGDTEGIVNYPLSIRGIEFAAFLIDREEERRWSFRSKDFFDCNSFARKHFDGGGHYNAAGGRSSLSVEENLTKFKNAIQEYKHILNTKHRQ